MSATDLITDRDALERAAIEAVCAAHYYDLMDSLDDASDADLLAIVEGRNGCPGCGL
jgi:hypothetical protein